MEPNRRRATARPEQPTASTNTPSRQEHRSLLPKPSQHDEKPPQKESMPSSSSSSSTISSPIRPKTSLTPVACDICRKKKIKCDGRKPTCSPCANYRRPCKYRMPGQAEGLRRRTLELQKSSQDTQRFLELLKSAPDDVAEDLFRNLRAQGTPTNPLGVAAPSIVQPSNAITGLDIHYPNAFPVLEPLGIADIELRFLGLGVDESKPSKRPPTFLDQSETRTKKSPEDKGGPSGLKLQHDLRLQSADFSRWTSVPIPNSLAACAITFYLANEHPLLAIFDADLFLDDLIADRGQFCSTLFVSSLLAWSCATYGQFDLEAKALSTLLLEESQARWKQTVLEDDDDDDDPSLPTVSAAIFLALTCNHHGRDKDGLEYLDASAELGRRLHLFDRNRSSPPPRSFGDERTRAAASFIAWGVFGWHTLHSIYFRRQHQIREAPILPIPGDESGPPLAKYMGSTFTWISKFWLIVHQVFGDGIAGYSRLALPEAKAAFQKLFSWSDSLPDSVRRSDGCPHHVYVMHIWYHTAILDVSRPFLGTKHEGPVGAYNASMQQLKRVLFLYRQRFEETNSTMLVTPGFLYLLNDIYRHIESPEAHFYFVWSLRGCLAIAAWNPGLSGISKAFLSLGRRLGVFERYGWGENVLGAGEKAAVGSLAEDGEYRSLYPINIGLADASKDEMANMEELANEYQQRGQQRTRDGSSALEEDAKDVWKGDPMDLELTLSEATAPDGSK